MRIESALFGKLLLSDLEAIDGLLDKDLSGLKNARIILFGGTGFVGTWLTTSILYLNSARDLNINIDIVTRNEKMARTKFWGLDTSYRLNFIELDLSRHSKRRFNEYDIFVNGATSSTLKSGGNNLHSVGNSSYSASRIIEDSARRFRNCPIVVNLSSGSVYEKSRSINMALSELDAVALVGRTEYESAKLITEKFLENLEKESLIRLLNLRLFAFYGPLLELNEHFAIGNFVRDAMLKRDIVIKGSRFTKRSYLYPTDLVVAILKFVNNGKAGNFNIGSGNSMSMSEVASLVGEIWHTEGLVFTPEDSVRPNYYWPDIGLAKQELGEVEVVSMVEGLHRWKAWLSQVHDRSE